MSRKKQARGCILFDGVEVALLVALAAQLVAGTFLPRPLYALALILPIQALAAMLYLVRWTKAAWRPARTNPFRFHLPAVALIVLPSSLLAVDPLRSGLVAGVLLVLFFSHFAFLEAFLAAERGWCSPVGFARLVAGGGALIVVGRFVARFRAAVYLPWYNLAPPDGLSVVPFDHLYDLLLVAAFPVVAMRVLVRALPPRAGPGRAVAEVSGSTRGGALTQGVGRGAGIEGVCLALIVIGIVFSFSRAAWIALGAEAMVLVFSCLSRKRAWIVTLSLGAAGIAVVFIPGVADRVVSMFSVTHPTTMQRLDQWAVALEALGRSPFAGYGLGSFGDLYVHARPVTGIAHWCPHNLYLHIAVECGLPALFVFLVWIGDFLRQAPATLRAALAPSASPRAVLRYAGIVAVVGVLCYGLFDL